MNKAMFSSASAEWGTPDDLFHALDKEFGFGLDAAATRDNAKVSTFFSKEDDALARTWHVASKGKAVWLNPPYGREVPKWIRKASEEGKKVTVVCLIAARTDTKMFHEICKKGEIQFLPGRLHFLQEGRELKHGAPFPSMLVIFRPGGKPKMWAGLVSKRCKR